MLLSHVPAHFKARRDALMKANPGATFLFPSSKEILRNPDVHFGFRQESNFFYLTSFEEPEAFLVLSPAADKASGYRMTLFVRRRDAEKEMWEGERHGTEGAVKVFGADEAFPIDELSRRLPDLLKGSDKVFYRIGQDEEADRHVLGALETYRRSQGRSGKSLAPIADPNEVIGEMRMFKSPAEADLMRKACVVTAESHKAAMQEVRPGWNEAEVEALIDYNMRRKGCQRMGYGSIVAGGKNATCLHYRSNNEELKDGDLLLIDAGGEHDYYTSDITRTFPVGRKFTDAQAKLYDLTLKAQLAAIAMAKPGATLPGIHRRVCEILVEGLVQLGLLKGKVDDIIKTGGHRRFYPHNTSHWLGMDVHDVGLYTIKGEPRPLEPGMVFTIEPGLYVQPTDMDAPAEYRNIGIRIEDDILITATGCEVLTQDVPKERADIEQLRAQALSR
jgi:Xaa-Pro aminopeptidase